MSVQECRNEHKNLHDEQRLITEKQQELHEVISEHETASVTGTRYPTALECSAALQRVEYSKLNSHFPTAVSSGCGKSSLNNSCLNLNPNDVGIAPTNVTETTLKMRRYPNPGTQSPRPWTVRYATPGPRPQRISDSQYFTAQALSIQHHHCSDPEPLPGVRLPDHPQLPVVQDSVVHCGRILIGRWRT